MFLSLLFFMHMGILPNCIMVLQKNELFSGTIKENLRWGIRERVWL